MTISDIAHHTASSCTHTILAVLLRQHGLMKTFTCRTPGDTFGFDAVTMGDVDGDGTMDFLITSAWSGVSGFHSGRVFLISSGVKRER